MISGAPVRLGVNPDACGRNVPATSGFPARRHRLEGAQVLAAPSRPAWRGRGRGLGSSLADRVKRRLAGRRHGAARWRGSDLQRIRRSLDPTAAASLGDQPGPGPEGVGPAASRRHPCRAQTTRFHPQTARRPRHAVVGSVGLVLLAIAIAGGTIVHPVLFVLDVLALVMFVTPFRAGGHGARTY